jgi:ribosomal protein L11 methyltransferase
MPWIALTLEVDADAAEAMSEALMQAGAQSVALEALERPSPTVQALLRPAEDADRLVREAAHAVGLATAPPFATRTVPDEDWVRTTQAQFEPLEVGARLWIGPSWCEPPPQRTAVRIDPGLAFGTGSHPTTRLALSWLEEIPLDGRAVLDVGAGSGILSLAARRLGARPVVGVERELESVLLAGANRRLNDVDASLVGGTVAALGRAAFDLIVANLLSAHLRVELQSLAARLRSGGDFVYSGALTVERRELMALFEEVDLEPVAEKIEGEWSSWRLRAVAS